MAPPFDGLDLRSLETLAKDLKTASDDVRRNYDLMLAEHKNLGKATQETKDALDKSLTEQNKLQLRVQDIEQKMVRFLEGDAFRQAIGQPPKTVGELFTESDGYKEFLTSRRSRGSYRHHFEDILSTKAILSSGWPIQAQRLPAPVLLPQRPLTIRDLMAPGRTTSNAVEYVRETAFTNAAAVVAEGAAKPESTKTFVLVSNPVVLIAHWIKTSVQALQDIPQLRSIIDTNLLYGLAFVEEQQLLLGSGVGGNLNGIYTQATALTPAPVAGTTTLDVIRMMILQVQTANFVPDGIVLNPVDFAAIELAKDTTGRYIVGNPQGTLRPTLWGLPVIVSQSMAAGTGLVGAFGTQSQIFDRMDAAIFVSTEDQDNFIKNMVTVLAEERLTSVVYQTTAFVKIADLTP